MTTGLYVPGTEEKDHRKLIMSQQLVAGQCATNTDNIATNTAAIATLNSATYVNSIAGNHGAFTLGTGLNNNTNSLVVSLSTITNSLSGNVSLNNVANFFDGPSVAQGSTGTWFASGTVTIQDTAGAATITAKLWDGTTVIGSTIATIAAINGRVAISLSGYIASPAGNIRISVKDGSSTSGFILANQSGLGADSTISAIRIA